MSWLYLNNGGFLNSTFFFAIITLLVGLSAYRIYAKQKTDRKREAATVLLSEVSRVVQALPAIKEDFARNGFLVEGRYLLRTSSWDKYKYILLPAMTIEQWSALKNFYDSVSKYDNAIKINDSYFDANTEQIWVSLHKHYLRELEAETIPDPPDISKAKLSSKTSAKIKYFTQLYINNTLEHAGYSPQKPINMAREALEGIDENLLVSSVGTHLTEITQYRTLVERLKFW